MKKFESAPTTPPARIATGIPYVTQNSLTASAKGGLSNTEKVKLAYVLPKFSAGKERLTPPGSSINPEGNKDPVEKLASIGIEYNPIFASEETPILNDAGACPDEIPFYVRKLLT